MLYRISVFVEDSREAEDLVLLDFEERLGAAVPHYADIWIEPVL